MRRWHRAPTRLPEQGPVGSPHTTADQPCTRVRPARRSTAPQALAAVRGSRGETPRLRRGLTGLRRQRPLGAQPTRNPVTPGHRVPRHSARVCGSKGKRDCGGSEAPEHPPPRQPGKKGKQAAEFLDVLQPRDTGQPAGPRGLPSATGSRRYHSAEAAARRRHPALQTAACPRLPGEPANRRQPLPAVPPDSRRTCSDRG